MRKPQILFLCTGNSARSQMVEGFMRCYAGDHFEVHSAGLDPRGVNPHAGRGCAFAGGEVSHPRDRLSLPLTPEGPHA